MGRHPAAGPFGSYFPDVWINTWGLYRSPSLLLGDNRMDDALPTVGVTMRFLALCQLHGSHRATVGLLAEGRRAGAPGLPGDDDWTRWNGAQVRAAVEYLENGRDAAPRAERPG